MGRPLRSQWTTGWAELTAPIYSLEHFVTRERRTRCLNQQMTPKQRSVDGRSNQPDRPPCRSLQTINGLVTRP